MSEFTYTTQEENRKNYLESYLSNSAKIISEMNEDEADKEIVKTNRMIKDLHELMQACYDNDQYVIPRDEYEDVSRLVRIRTKRSKKEMDSIKLDVPTYYVYGMGMYALMEGIILSSSTRKTLNYDNCHKKGRVYNINCIREDIRESHDFRLAIPCYGGLFVPKKSVITEMLRGTFDLNFFEVSHNK